MKPRRTAIDPYREAVALDRISVDVIITAGLGAGRHFGAQCEILDAIADAMIWGASKAACCKRIGISTRTAERWARRRQAVLDGLGDI